MVISSNGVIKALSKLEQRREMDKVGKRLLLCFFILFFFFCFDGGSGKAQSRVLPGYRVLAIGDGRCEKGQQEVGDMNIKIENPKMGWEVRIHESTCI